MCRHPPGASQARAAGDLAPGPAWVAGVLTGQTSQEELEEAKAHVVLQSIAGLPSVLGLGG